MTSKFRSTQPSSGMGGVQEASWGVLGLSGGVRGASWESLGRSWGDLGATFKAVRFRTVFLINFERQKGAKREAFWDPKWSQNRSQNKTKSKSIFKSEQIPFKTVSRSSWSRLGPLLSNLDQAWGHLGAMRSRLERPKSLIFLRFFNTFLTIRILNENSARDRSGGLLGTSWGDLGASWAELRPIWAPKRPQKGGQKAPKRLQKGDQNGIKISIDF
jgi:hypothetical protein